MEKLNLNKFSDKKLENISSVIGGGDITTSWEGSSKCGWDTLHDANGDGEASCGETVDFSDGASGTVTCQEEVLA